MVLCKEKESIEAKRSELIECVKKYGVNASQTIKMSQELDILINNYLLLKNKMYLNNSK